MKKSLLFLLLFLGFAIQGAFAQKEQDADTLLWNGKRYFVSINRNVPSVVMSYFQRVGADAPFQSWSLNNSRGHIAQLELINNEIRVNTIEAKRFKTRTGNLWTETGIDTIVSPDYFQISPLTKEQPLDESAVVADWYSGILELRLLAKDKKEQKSDEARGTRYLNVVNGQVVDNVFISDKTMAEYQSGRAKLGHDQAKVYYLNERFKEFYLHCASDREGVTYNGHNGLFQQKANGLTNHNIDAVGDSLSRDFACVTRILTHHDAHIVNVVIHNGVDEAWNFILAADARHRIDDGEYVPAFFHID